MFRLYEPYEQRDLTVENIFKNLKEREQKVVANRTVKASLNAKLDEMGLSEEQLITILKQKSEQK